MQYDYYYVCLKYKYCRVDIKTKSSSMIKLSHAIT